MDLLELRHFVYQHFVETGSAPSRIDLARVVGELDAVDSLLEELHARHMLVLDDRPERRGEIRMALPFSAEPTPFRVVTDAGAWWANCAWDSMAVLAALNSDGIIRSTWSDSGAPLELQVSHGRLDSDDGYVRFLVPAGRWWADIVFT